MTQKGEIERGRREIIRALRLLYKRGLISGADGNVSLRLSDGGILITPSGRHKGILCPEEVSLLDPLGTLKEGPSPSSELKMHQAIYEKSPGTKAIIHAHPPWTTALYLAGLSLNTPPILVEATYVIGDVARLEYFPPGSKALARETGAAMEKAKACVLMNHGVVTRGRDMEDALILMESIENVSKTTALSYMLGDGLHGASIPLPPSRR